MEGDEGREMFKKERRWRGRGKEDVKRKVEEVMEGTREGRWRGRGKGDV